MKIAIINDTHFGARNDSSLFLEHFLSFFENQFFPYLEENNIDTIIHLGDLMDRRKYVNFNTLNLVRTKFIEKIKEKNIKFHMILGNHDTFYKNTNEVNSTKELFSHYDFFKLYESPEKVKFDGLEIMMIPWICKENKDDVVSFIQLGWMPYSEYQGLTVFYNYPKYLEVSFGLNFFISCYNPHEIYVPFSS